MLRAAAIVMVLFSHVLWIYPVNTSTVRLIFELFGFWGVELFFVLSGFLIGTMLYKSYISETFSISTVLRFLKRRWFRTLPTYYLVLVLNIIIAFFIGYQIDNVTLYFFFLQNMLHKAPVFFPESWSLSVEEVAYLVLPFALLIGIASAHKNKAKRFFVVVLFLFTFFLLAKVFFNYMHTVLNLTDWSAHLKSVVIYRIDAILTGVVLAWFRYNFLSFWKRYQLFFLLLSAGIFSFLLFGVPYFNLTIEQVPFFWNICYLPLTSLGFAFLFPFFSEWNFSTAWFKTPIVITSKISYSIYLVHYSIILQLLKYFIDTTALSAVERYFLTFFYLVTTFLVSFALHQVYEKPMMNLRDKK